MTARSLPPVFSQNRIIASRPVFEPCPVFEPLSSNFPSRFPFTHFGYIDIVSFGNWIWFSSWMFYVGNWTSRGILWDYNCVSMQVCYLLVILFFVLLLYHIIHPWHDSLGPPERSPGPSRPFMKSFVMLGGLRLCPSCSLLRSATIGGPNLAPCFFKS